MPSPSDIKAGLAAAASKAATDTHRAQAGAAPTGGPQGVFDVSNDGTTWHPAVRLRASTGTTFTVVDGEVQLETAASGLVEYATTATFRASPPPADGTVFRIVSPPGEYRYSTSSGAGWADDDRTILKPTSVLLGANGRAFSTAAGATCPTFDALRGLKSGKQDHVHLQSHTTFGDGGGGIFDRVAVGSYVDDGGLCAVSGSWAWVRRYAGSIDVAWFGAVGDGTTDDISAIESAIAAAPAGSVITGDKAKTYYITHGATVTKGLTFSGFKLYMPATSTRVVNVPTISSSCDAMLTFWNGATRSVVSGLAVETAGTIDGITLDGMTFDAGAHIGDAYRTRSSMVYLFGCKNIEIKGCTFAHGASEIILSDAFCDRISCHDNWFIDCNHMGISGLQWSNAIVHSNHFIDVWGTSEICFYKAKIFGNVVKTSAGGNNGWWITDGTLNCKVDFELYDNTISGDIAYPILVNQYAAAANFENVNICRNRIFAGAATGAGTHFIWVTSPNGGVLHVDENYISEAGCGASAGAGIYLEGTSTAKEITMNRNTFDLVSSQMYQGVVVNAANASPLAVDDLRVTGSGDFRQSVTSDAKAYGNAVLLGSTDRTLQAVRRPVIHGREHYRDTSTATVLNVADHKVVDFACAAKTVTAINAAPGPLVLSNTGSAYVTLDHSASIDCPFATDARIAPGERMALESTAATGGTIKVVSGDALDMLRKLWPLAVVPFAVFHADYRKTLSGSDVLTWASLIGSLTLTVPGAATSPSVGTSWTDGRATLDFDGVLDRLAVAIPGDFNGDDTPITIFAAFVDGTGTPVSVSQDGSSADNACRLFNNSTTETWGIRTVGGSALHATRTGMSTGPRVIATSLSASGSMRITQGGTTGTTAMGALGAIANQNTLTIGDIYATTASGQQYNGALRCVTVAKGLNDAQIAAVLQNWELVL